MTYPRHYRNAPITEAIIDLRVVPCSDLTLEQLDQLATNWQKEYPTVTPISELRGRLEFRPDEVASASADQAKLGVKLVSSDSKYVVQSRLGGITISRLAPYDQWEPFRDEARRIWTQFCPVSNPEKVTRLAVRYINRFDIPGSHIDLKEYFRTSPEISPDLPQELGAFFMQLQILQEDISAKLLINQTIIPPAREGAISVILDFDLFREDDVPQDDSGIWDYFEMLHSRKNDVFEACITDKTKKLLL